MAKINCKIFGCNNLVKLCLCFALFGLFLTTDMQAQISYNLESGNETWPADKREAIIKAMDEAVDHYNSYGYFVKTLSVTYNPDVPTADANYAGRIRFGGSISTRTALHEISHTLGVGTTTAWRNGFAGDFWTGPKANARIVLYNGEDAKIKGDKWHFWSSTGPSYGLNYPKGDGSTNRIRHVKMVSAFRWDMGIVSDSDNDGMPDDWEMFYFKNLAQNGSTDYDDDGVSNLDEYIADTNPTSKFEWVKVDDRNEAVTYDGNWGEWPSDPSYNTTVNYSEVTDAIVTFRFTGTKVRYYGFKRNDLGFADIYINNEFKTSVDCYAPELHPDVLLFESDSLEYGEHTIIVVVKGTKNASSSGTEIIIDAFEFLEGEISNSLSDNKWEDSRKPLRIYPNPAKEEFTILSMLDEEAIVNIFDTHGRLIYKSPLKTELRLNKSVIGSSGLFCVSVNAKSGTYYEKLIIE